MFICTALINNVPTLVAFIGNQMYTLFTNTGSYPTGKAMTALWDDDDPLTVKDVVRAGCQVVLLGGTDNIQLTVDGLNSSTSFTSTFENTIQFVNNSGGDITFVGSGAITFYENSGVYLLINDDPPGVYSKNIGMQLISTNANFQLCGFYMDYKTGASWMEN